MSRRALTERLSSLVEHGVLRRAAYSDRPPRYDYLLTAKGEGLLPVLIALQDRGTRHVMGDGSLTAAPGSEEIRRVHDLVGHRVPITVDGPTVLFFFPGAFAPGAQAYPPGWGDIPGTAGCTLEARTYATRAAEFAALGVHITGVSSQRPDQQAAFAEHANLPFPLVSDQDGRLAASLRLPTFRAGGTDRFKRLTLLVDAGAIVRSVQFPVPDPAGSVDEMLHRVRH
ncbi:redoxin domain-containing protein [Actinoplanes sp. NPDC051494]|uniref:redoxin domain-containing protein n=1 Tax=Actinoplanes sp. NPDC051494 TaxID=3363907 RepID=UPI0037964F55